MHSFNFLSEVRLAALSVNGGSLARLSLNHKTPPSSVSNGEAVLVRLKIILQLSVRAGPLLRPPNPATPPEAADYGGGGGNDRLV